MIDNDIYLLVTEVFGLDIGSSQIAHHRQQVCKVILVISLSLSQAEQ